MGLSMGVRELVCYAVIDAIRYLTGYVFSAGNTQENKIHEPRSPRDIGALQMLLTTWAHQPNIDRGSDNQRAL